MYERLVKADDRDAPDLVIGGQSASSSHLCHSPSLRLLDTDPAEIFRYAVADTVIIFPPQSKVEEGYTERAALDRKEESKVFEKPFEKADHVRPPCPFLSICGEVE